MDAATRGAAALDAGKHEEAIKEFTKAIELMPNAVDYYIKRSTAYQRSVPPQYEAALGDAELAVHLAIKRAKRELIGQAQLRRVIIMFSMGRIADAGFILEVVKRYDAKNKMISIWESKIRSKLEVMADDDENKIVRAKEIPELRAGSGKDQTKAAAISTIVEAPAAKEVVQTPASQIKHDWYQSKEKVYFTLLVKGVPKELTSIDIEENSISISFPLQTGSTYTYALDPLFAPIDAASSTSNITPSKIELVLQKQMVGRQWKTLEGTEPLSAAKTSTDAIEDPVRKAVLAEATKGPVYPTSSKNGPKDWDKVVEDIVKPKEEDGEGAKAGFEDDEGDPANAFFKHLYANADEDTRRAINKSYQESGGTVLSTNWSEVGSKRVEISPPDGMEAKKW